MFGFLQRRKPIADAAALADFIDQNAAFIVQKGIYEYARARSGHYSKVLFREPGFQEAVEVSRWRAYPVGLAMIAELAEGVLRPHSHDPQSQLQRVLQLVLSVFDRYPVPPVIGEKAWLESRDELAGRIEKLLMHAPKGAADIPEPYTRIYFDMMPIHEKLRGPDFPTLRNYMRVSLCNIHEELVKRMRIDDVVPALRKMQMAEPASAING